MQHRWGCVTSRKMVIARMKVSLQVRTRKSRIDIIDGLRSFIEADNHSAVDVGGLRRCTIPVHVKKPQFSEVFPDAVIREGADELTLRAKEVGSRRTFIDTKHTYQVERWEPPLVDADWHAFCQAVCKGIEGKEWEACCTITAESCFRRQGPKRFSDSQKVKALWTMTAARDRDDEFL